jgi:hypothetical protein
VIDYRTASDIIHLTPAYACGLAAAAGYQVEMHWEVPLDSAAATAWNVRGRPVIYFADYGCTLDTLAHELAHTIEGRDTDLEHNADFDTLCLLVEEQLRDVL